MSIHAAEQMSDVALVDAVKAAACQERSATARLIALLVEFDARRLYLGEGCSSLFTYCHRVLRLSEHAAYGRIEAARAARRYPPILDRLREGRITLTTVALLGPHLTPENHRQLLDESQDKTRREVEVIVARLRPQPAVPTAIRKSPMPAPIASPGEADLFTAKTEVNVVGSPPSPRPAVLKPLSPEAYKVQVTIPRQTHDKLRRAQELLRHAIPNGDVAIILDRALTLLVADLERGRGGQVSAPRAARTSARGARHIPAAVRREVWARDDGQCTFVGASGRCGERNFIEFHHLKPFAVGGPPTAENLTLRCRAHNAHEAEVYFGARLPLLVRERGPDVAWLAESGE